MYVICYVDKEKKVTRKRGRNKVDRPKNSSTRYRHHEGIRETAVMRESTDIKVRGVLFRSLRKFYEKSFCGFTLNNFCFKRFSLLRAYFSVDDEEKTSGFLPPKVEVKMMNEEVQGVVQEFRLL